MPVPADAMVINGGTYYGVSKAWFEQVNPEKQKLYFTLTIPDSVTKIASDGFRDSYSPDKTNNGAVTSNDKVGTYSVVGIDFSQATSLETIGSQAAMGVPLEGVLDLSGCTALKTIEKSAFNGCAGLTGIILPDSLEVLGAADGGSGSVFNGCTGLTFVRAASSAEDATFELPAGLKVIGKQAFASAFADGVSFNVRIPASVETIGSEAFYVQKSGGKVTIPQIFIERTGGYKGYDSGAFKAATTAERLLVLPNAAAYNEIGGVTRITKTYPVTLEFKAKGDVVATQQKLYGQSIQYEYDDEAACWVVNDQYELPQIPEGSVETKPGFDAGWQIYGDTKVLTSTSKVSGWTDDKLAVEPTATDVVSAPSVSYTVNGEVVDTENGVPSLTVPITEDTDGSVGVEVTHPLATEEAKASGTYVYFKYCWWDEVDNSVNGPRSESEPELFSTAETSSDYNRVYTDNASIPIRSEEDARTDGDYYLVEIYGYYVENNGEPQQFYKSNHNFIAGGHTDNKAYLMNVDVVDENPVSIAPAPITVYMGGEGYTGVVDGEGNLGESNGLPEPGYYITLPDSLNEVFGGDVAEDLTDNMTISYEKDGVTREWKLELYGSDAHSTDVDDVTRQRYIYRILPGRTQDGEEIPVRIQVTDPETGETVTNDDFSPSLGEQYKEYDISLFQGDLDPDCFSVTLQASEEQGGKTYTRPVKIDSSKLVVRGLTDENTLSDVVTDSSDVSGDEVSAVVPEDAAYYVNDSNVALEDTEGVKLLVDEAMDDKVLVDYIETNMPEAIPDGSYAVDQKYLDLVDSKNGNAYLTLHEGQSVKVYWPVPDDAQADAAATVVHFDALDRAYENIDDELKKNSPDVIEAPMVTIDGKRYYEFETASFSPFVLMYDQAPAQPSVPGGSEGSGSDALPATGDNSLAIVVALVVAGGALVACSRWAATRGNRM